MIKSSLFLLTVFTITSLFASNNKQQISYSVSSPIYSGLDRIFNTSSDSWRNSNFEVYLWNRGSKVLIFDTIDYEYQALMFKRLAFYTEKKGFRGTISSLQELEGLKGWKGHDYRAIDLALFFNKIERDKLEMTEAESILLSILVNSRIIVKTRRGYISGGGAVLSFSQSSDYNHRKYILEHEAYHGLFFTDPSFRKFASLVWNNMDKDSKEIWKMYLDYLGYDNTDRRLVINEFVAYMLQNTGKEEYDYFMQLIYYRLRRAYPDKKSYVETFFKTHPEAYIESIKKLDNYVGKIIIN